MGLTIEDSKDENSIKGEMKADIISFGKILLQLCISSFCIQYSLNYLWYCIILPI